MQETEAAAVQGQGTQEGPGAPVHTNGSAQGSELHELLRALQAMRTGDFSVRMPTEAGLLGKIADTFNDIVATNQRFALQLEHVGQRRRQGGSTRQRVRIGLAAGAWGEMESSVNALIDDLLWPTTEVTRTIEAVAQGDLLVRPCGSMWTAGRSRASSCAPPRSSTP